MPNRRRLIADIGEAAFRARHALKYQLDIFSTTIASFDLRSINDDVDDIVRNCITFPYFV